MAMPLYTQHFCIKTRGKNVSGVSYSKSERVNALAILLLYCKDYKKNSVGFYFLVYLKYAFFQFLLNSGNSGSA